MPPSAPTIALLSPGSMGASLARLLTAHGCTVITSLINRSPATQKRAKDAGMIDIGSGGMKEMVKRSRWIVSVLPPGDAFGLAQKVVGAAKDAHIEGEVASGGQELYFADCNAVNPDTAKKIASLFASYNSSSTTSASSQIKIRFVDAGIIGGPATFNEDPSTNYVPTIYASAHPDDVNILDEFVSFGRFGWIVKALKGEGTGVGDASALKMSYAGITKGLIGISTTMILAAHASSPSTSRALLQELHASQPVLLNRMTRSVPGMLPKAYRWVGEMQEIAGFVGGEEGKIYQGLADLYARVEKSLKEGESGGADVQVLRDFIAEAKKTIEQAK